ncbi:unnamed protein product [Ectocarpus sp. CCAP 1310/34]|nr:unnamed protein product [Ectocarpus sp. CCAP 1310/34]
MISFLKVTVIHLVETRSFLLRRASNILYSSFAASGNHSRRLCMSPSDYSAPCQLPAARESLHPSAIC